MKRTTIRIFNKIQHEVPSCQIQRAFTDPTKPQKKTEATQVVTASFAVAKGISVEVSCRMQRINNLTNIFFHSERVLSLTFFKF